MPIVPLYGHEPLRRRLAEASTRGALPSSLLLHGPRGVGKQRLALWLAQLLLCTGEGPPCERCIACRCVRELRYADLYWFFPRPRLKAPDPSAADVLEDYTEAIAERVARHGLYAAPSGSEAIYVATVRTIVQKAAVSPAVGRRKIFVVGDAERMVPQEGAEQAANAFLKLLEEPPADTTIILTSSEPGALLPTIRSRVAAFRVPPLGEHDVRAFLADEAVRDVLADEDGIPATRDPAALVDFAGGAPGRLFSGAALAGAASAAQALLEAAARGTGRRSTSAERYATALAQGGADARGGFAASLSALTPLLRRRAAEALGRGDAAAAAGAAGAVDAVARAELRAAGNVNPQLVAARLLRELSDHL